MQDGNKIVHLSIATSERWRDKQSGDQRERTEWHRVVVFNDRLADLAERFLRKGSKVYVEGALQTRKWTGNDGQERYSTEVVLQRGRGEMTLLDSRGEGGGAPSHESGSGAGKGQPAASGAASGLEFDDDIPF
jgi:single-strand DNA-binding protein